MKLTTRTVEKVWGRRLLPEPFARQHAEPVGEIWFEPPAQLNSLLIKYLFTSAKLSVQVHPDDADVGPGQSGKEECWLVLDAEPGAQLAIGFEQPRQPDEVHRAALDGSIESMLAWRSVRAGDFFYIPAGTVHAIGAGLTLVEVQQNSDITYRLYDYGRSRDLHLDAALVVARLHPHPDDLRRGGIGAHTVSLVDGPHFVLDHCVGPMSPNLAQRHGGPVAVLPLSGAAMVGEDRIAAGECGVAARIEDLAIEDRSRCLIASVP